MAISIFSSNVYHVDDKDYVESHLPRNSSKDSCFYCGIKLIKYKNVKRLPDDAYTVDHFVPLSKGGKNYQSNKVPCCYKCNQEKADKLPQEYIKDQK